MTDANADRRSVATDALATLGTIIDHKQKRDAIHLAVIPVVAAGYLDPGAHVLLQDGLAHRAEVNKGHGIVDPFLAEVVRPGQHFWLVIYPRVITSLRHVWTHPALTDEAGSPAGAPTDKVTSAHNRLTEIARLVDLSHDALLQAAEEYVAGGQYVTEYGSDTWRDRFPAEEFWPLYRLVTGKPVPDDMTDNFFSCSC